MHSNWWLTSLSVLEVSSATCALITLLRRRIAATWPSLSAAIAIEVVTNLTLMSFMAWRVPYFAYFYTYWTFAALQSALRMWLLADVVRSFPHIGFLRRSAYSFVLTSAAFAWFAAAALTFHNALRLTSAIAPLAILMDRCASIGWGAFFVVLLGAVKLFQVHWGAIGARITTGIVARIAGNLLVAELLAQQSHTLHLVANGLDSIVTITVMLFWTRFLLNTPLGSPYSEDQTSQDRAFGYPDPCIFDRRESSTRCT